MSRKITAEELSAFVAHIPNPLERYGQEFCNYFNIIDSDLFYEEDVNEAWIKMQKYIEP